MKKILVGLLVVVLSLISFGYYEKSNQLNGDKWIGIGILILTFIVIPIFLYSRFKNKEVRNRMLNFDLKNKKATENQ
jgi:hypothetical protein